MNRWPKVALGQVLQRSDEFAVLDTEAEYHELTIKLWGKGVVSRGKVRGSDVSTARRLVRGDQLVLSKIDARHGAIGVVPSELDGAIVSNDFPSFCVDRHKVEPGFLGWFVRSAPFVALCKASSEGTTNRVRIKEERFLSQIVALPPLAEQQRIVARLDALADKVRQVTEKLDATEADAEAMLRAYLFSPPGEKVVKRPMLDMLRLRQPDVTVDRLQQYRFAGVYSFGRGVFAGAFRAGSDFAYERLSTVRAGDFTYPKLMAWEGAFGVVPPECDGMVVSPEFPVFSVATGVILPEILDIHFHTPEVWPGLAELSTGTNMRRRRLQPSVFLAYRMPVPSMSTQLKLRELHGRTRRLKVHHATIREANSALLPAMLERLFHQYA